MNTAITESTIVSPDSRGGPRAVPLRERWAYAMGAFLETWGSTGIKNTANQVLNITLGVSPVVIGTVFSIMRLWDAVSDPLAGNISDNLRTRWGRRRPLLFIGALLAGLTFPLLWHVPAGDDTVQFIWLLFAGLLFYTAFTSFTVPYHALGYELVHDYHGKTKLFALRTACATVMSFGIGWIFPLVTGGWLGSPQRSVNILAWVIALLVAGTAMIPVFLIRDGGAGTQPAQPKVPLRTALGYAFSSRPFLLVALMSAIGSLGLNAVTVFGTYVNVYYVHGGDVKTAAVIGGIQWTVSAVVLLACMPVLSALGKKWGKRIALYACLGIAILGTISKWFFYNPDHPYWIIGVVFFLGPGNAGVAIFTQAMIADVCEYEAMRRGVRMEAMFGAVQTWMQKTSSSLGVLLSGLLLSWIGFSVAEGADQSRQTLYSMRVLFSFFPLIALVCGCVLISFYRLDRQRMQEVRAELDTRSG